MFNMESPVPVSGPVSVPLSVPVALAFIVTDAVSFAFPVTGVISTPLISDINGE